MDHFLVNRLVEMLEKAKGGMDPFDLERYLTAGTLAMLDGGEPVLAMSENEARGYICSAESLYEYNVTILATRKELHEAIRTAKNESLQALRLMDKLGEMGDVEYDGGLADVEHFLNDALRCLRAAQALKPTGKDGN